jgi:BolA family transcriptional regulator, general stress-responsive regulator
MTTRDTMLTILTDALHPHVLEVVDESHLHAGHGGWREGGETHFRIRVVADAFDGKSRIERHRMVNALLERELRQGVHALAIEAKGRAD